MIVYFSPVKGMYHICRRKGRSIFERENIKKSGYSFCGERVKKKIKNASQNHETQHKFVHMGQQWKVMDISRITHVLPTIMCYIF